MFAEELNLTGPDPTLTEGNETEQTVQPAALPVPKIRQPEGGPTGQDSFYSQGAATGGHTVPLMLLLHILLMSLGEPVFYVLKT